MAYIDQDTKKTLKVAVDKVLKRYNAKGSLSIKNHSTLTLTLKSGPALANDVMDATEYFKKNIYKGQDVNTYWIGRTFGGESYHFLSEIVKAMNDKNYDNSDVQSDYFDVGYYISVKIGSYDTEYTPV